MNVFLQGLSSCLGVDKNHGLSRMLGKEVFNKLPLSHFTFLSLRKLKFELLNVLKCLLCCPIDCGCGLVYKLICDILCVIVNCSREQYVLGIDLDLLEVLVYYQVKIILEALVEKGSVCLIKNDHLALREVESWTAASFKFVSN